MFKKTLCAVIAASLLSNFALCAFDTEMDTILRGGRKTSGQCVNGNISQQVSGQPTPTEIPIQFTATGSGFNLGSCNITAAVTDVTNCLQALGPINGCSYAAMITVPIVIDFKCPFKCTPAVIINTVSPVPSFLSSPNAPCAFLLSNVNVSQNTGPSSTTLVIYAIVAGTNATIVTEFLVGLIDLISFDFEAVACSSCCNQNNCSTKIGELAK